MWVALLKCACPLGINYCTTSTLYLLFPLLLSELRGKNLPVLMICATNRPNSLDEAFRRTGRFDIEYAMRFPNRDARKRFVFIKMYSGIHLFLFKITVYYTVGIMVVFFWASQKSSRTCLQRDNVLHMIMYKI